MEVVERPSGTRGFSVVPRRWVVERTFSWISRNRRMSKDYERKVQTSETLIQVAMIRLLLARLARHLRTSSQPSALGHKPFPMAFGDNFDDAINHLYSGLIVNRVGRHWHAGGPFFSVGQGIVRQIGIIQVREYREINHAQRSIAAGGRLPTDEVLPDVGGHYHAPGAQSHIDRLAPKLRQEVGQS